MPDAVDDHDSESDRLTRLSQSRTVRAADHLMPFGGSMSAEMGQIAADLGEEDRRDQRMLETVGKDFHDQPAVEAVGVDLAPISAVDPQFDDFAFRTIARETFKKVREARGTERLDEADALLSPTMQAEVSQEVSGEIAAHRHHLLPGLEVEEATIVLVAVTGGREVIDRPSRRRRRGDRARRRHPGRGRGRHDGAAVVGTLALRARPLYRHFPDRP